MSQRPDRAARSAATLADADIDAILDRVPCVAERPRTLRRLVGGLTNVIVQVSGPRGIAVARVATDDSALLAIDRDAEYLASLAAASTGVAPEVLCRDRAAGVLVVGWVDGRTLGPGDLHDGAMLARVAELCRRLHGGPRFPAGFDMFQVQAGYLEIVLARGFRIPAGYLDLMPCLDRARSALAAHPAPTRPCHNDLLAENFIDAGNRLWMVDFEYSGNNDPAFELGNLAAESMLSADELGELVRLYHGADDAAAVAGDVARALLFGTVASYGWTLWGCIQNGSSTLDFDFWSWASEKYDRAAGGFSGPAFDALLAQVARS